MSLKNGFSRPLILGDFLIGVHAGAPGRAAAFHPADRRGLLPNAMQIGGDEAAHAEDDVHDDAGRDDEHAADRRVFLRKLRGSSSASSSAALSPSPTIAT